VQVPNVAEPETPFVDAQEELIEVESGDEGDQEIVMYTEY
jgi:hypothetical protein